jgi:hypothetical protein
MNLTRLAWTTAVIAISATVTVPIVIHAVHVLLVPAVVAVVLYVVVRVVNARLNRW